MRKLQNNIIKITIFFLILMFVCCGTSFAATNTDITEEVLIHNVQFAKTTSKKEKAFKNLFYYYSNTNNYDNMIEVSKELLNYKLSKKEKYDVYYNLARAYKTKRKFEDAIEAGQEAEYLRPKKIDIKMLMGEIYEENSLYELAVSKFKNVLELDDKHVTASIKIGNIYRLQENYKTALLYYEKAMALRQNLAADVYINAAECYKETGTPECAIEVLGNIKGKNKKASIILADIYKTRKNYLKAKAELKNYAYKKDVDIEIYCKLTELCIVSNEYEEAKKLLLYYKSKVKDKNVEIADFLIAEAYYMSGDKKTAEKIINNISKYTKSEYFKDMVKKIITFEKLKK